VKPPRSPGPPGPGRLVTERYPSQKGGNATRFPPSPYQRGRFDASYVISLEHMSVTY
jgi:hypothetical protein